MDDVVTHVVLLLQLRALTGPYLSGEAYGAPEDRWQNNLAPLHYPKKLTLSSTAQPLTHDMNRIMYCTWVVEFLVCMCLCLNLKLLINTTVVL